MSQTVCQIHSHSILTILWSKITTSQMMNVKVTQSWNPGTIQSMEFSRPELSLLQEIFPTQVSNPDLPHCGQILYQLSHKGSPIKLPYDPAIPLRQKHPKPGLKYLHVNVHSSVVYNRQKGGNNPMFINWWMELLKCGYAYIRIDLILEETKEV